MSLQALQSVIQQQLTTQRLMPAQVVDAIVDKYQQTEETIPDFLTRKVPTLDDMDQDLLLSPAYTPAFQQRKDCFAVMAEGSISRIDQGALVQQLLEAQTVTTFILPNGTQCTLTVPEICLQRYIRLLHLDSTMEPTVYAAIQQHVPQDAQPAFNTLARDTAWQGKNTLLTEFIPVLASTEIQRFHQLTDFVRTYRPKSMEELDKQLESYIRSCESDMTRAGEMSFHDDRLKEKYVYQGEGSHVHPNEEQQRSTFLHMMDQGRQLRELLHQLTQNHAIR